MPPAEFWTATPRETVAVIAASSWRLLQQQRAGVMGAWFSEAFARTKRLDPLEQTLGRIFDDAGLDEQEKRQRFLDRRDAARAWARRHNERMKKKTKADG